MNSFLIDGPLMTTFDRRKAVLERMAKDLVEHGHVDLMNERDAKAVLSAAGYNRIDVEILAAEARQMAFQSIVADEMGKS